MTTWQGIKIQSPLSSEDQNRLEARLRSSFRALLIDPIAWSDAIDLTQTLRYEDKQISTVKYFSVEECDYALAEIENKLRGQRPDAKIGYALHSPKRMQGELKKINYDFDNLSQIDQIRYSSMVFAFVSDLHRQFEEIAMQNDHKKLNSIFKKTIQPIISTVMKEELEKYQYQKAIGNLRKTLKNPEIHEEQKEDAINLLKSISSIERPTIKDINKANEALLLSYQYPKAVQTFQMALDRLQFENLHLAAVKNKIKNLQERGEILLKLKAPTRNDLLELNEHTEFFQELKHYDNLHATSAVFDTEIHRSLSEQTREQILHAGHLKETLNFYDVKYTNETYQNWLDFNKTLIILKTSLPFEEIPDFKDLSNQIALQLNQLVGQENFNLLQLPGLTSLLTLPAPASNEDVSRALKQMHANLVMQNKLLTNLQKLPFSQQKAYRETLTNFYFENKDDPARLTQVMRVLNKEIFNDLLIEDIHDEEIKFNNIRKQDTIHSSLLAFADRISHEIQHMPKAEKLHILKIINNVLNPEQNNEKLSHAKICFECGEKLLITKKTNSAARLLMSFGACILIVASIGIALGSQGILTPLCLYGLSMAFSLLMAVSLPAAIEANRHIHKTTEANKVFRETYTQLRKDLNTSVDPGVEPLPSPSPQEFGK